MTAMLTTTEGLLPAATIERLELITERGRLIDEAARSASTIRSYRSDWRQLQTWAEGLGVEVPDCDAIDTPLPVGVVKAYLIDRSNPAGPAPVAPVTLTRHLSAIRWWHHQAEHASPTDHPSIERAMAGIRRVEGRKVKQAKPIYLDDLQAMVAQLDGSPMAMRDRMVLSVGWWGGFRRSELVALRPDDFTDDPKGVIATLQRSKTDQEGNGRDVALWYQPDFGDVCPVMNLRQWLRMIDGDGPVVRRVDQWGNVSDRSLHGGGVSRTVKRAVASIGLDPDGYSGHSLRAGIVSECDRRGIPTSAIRLITGHKSDAMLSRYTRPRALFESSAGAWFRSDHE